MWPLQIYFSIFYINTLLLFFLSLAILHRKPAGSGGTEGDLWCRLDLICWSFLERVIGRMSIAVDNGEEIGRPGCGRAIPCFPACESPADIGAAAAAASDSGSSSIGRNSDCSLAGGEDGGEAEVQSSFKGPLETMDALEDSLPMRRGISKFYCGKSKSFAVISDAMGLSSGKELGKPESAYSRKRKKLLSLTGRWEAAECDRDRSGGSKRRANCSAAGIGGGGAQWASPPVETEKSSFPWRSFSLIDLEGIESLSSSSSSLSSMCYEEQKGFG